MDGEKLRRSITDNEIVIAPGVFDSLTAKIVEDLGFRAAYLGGYALGASTALTEPMLTRTDMLDQSRSILKEINIPLIIDGGAGFGNPAHTYKSFHDFATVGIAGAHIEDQVYPKRLHYFDGIKRIVSEDEMVTKIQFAKRGIDDSDNDMILIARTDAARGQRRSEQAETISDAVRRVNTYLDAGADVGMVFPQDIEELQYAIDNTDGPILTLIAEDREPKPSVEKLNAIGCDVAIYGLSATYLTARAIQDMYQSLKNDGTTGLQTQDCKDIRSYIENVIELPKYYNIEEKSGYK